MADHVLVNPGMRPLLPPPPHLAHSVAYILALMSDTCHMPQPTWPASKALDPLRPALLPALPPPDPLESLTYEWVVSAPCLPAVPKLTGKVPTVREAPPLRRAQQCGQRVTLCGGPHASTRSPTRPHTP